MSDNKEKRRCKECGSLQTYIKFTTDVRICRACGHVEKLNKEKKE